MPSLRAMSEKIEFVKEFGVTSDPNSRLEDLLTAVGAKDETRAVRLLDTAFNKNLDPSKMGQGEKAQAISRGIRQLNVFKLAFMSHQNAIQGMANTVRS